MGCRVAERFWRGSVLGIAGKGEISCPTLGWNGMSPALFGLTGIWINLVALDGAQSAADAERGAESPGRWVSLFLLDEMSPSSESSWVS